MNIQIYRGEEGVGDFEEGREKRVRSHVCRVGGGNVHLEKCPKASNNEGDHVLNSRRSIRERVISSQTKFGPVSHGEGRWGVGENVGVDIWKRDGGGKCRHFVLLSLTWG